jgi:hypothetical protein
MTQALYAHMNKKKKQKKQSAGQMTMISIGSWNHLDITLGVWLLLSP